MHALFHLVFFFHLSLSLLFFSFCLSSFHASNFSWYGYSLHCPWHSISILIMPLIPPVFHSCLFLLTFLLFFIIRSSCSPFSFLSSPSPPSFPFSFPRFHPLLLPRHPPAPHTVLPSFTRPISLLFLLSPLPPPPLPCTVRGDRADLLAVVIGAGAVTIHCPIKTVTSDIVASFL